MDTTMSLHGRHIISHYLIKLMSLSNLSFSLPLIHFSILLDASMITCATVSTPKEQLQPPWTCSFIHSPGPPPEASQQRSVRPSIGLNSFKLTNKITLCLVLMEDNLQGYHYIGARSIVGCGIAIFKPIEWFFQAPNVPYSKLLGVQLTIFDRWWDVTTTPIGNFVGTSHVVAIVVVIVVVDCSSSSINA